MSLGSPTGVIDVTINHVMIHVPCCQMSGPTS
jgi:hypothetical protein